MKSNESTTKQIFLIGLGFILLTSINMKKKKFGYYKLSKTCTQNLINDSTNISGRIFDLQSNKALSNSIFGIKESNILCLSDSIGYFRIKIKAGIYKFSASHISNSELVTKKILINPSYNYYFDIYLDSRIAH
jgi:hypothetical protein